jgi:phosphate-selective porin OprO/OprP
MTMKNKKAALRVGFLAAAALMGTAALGQGGGQGSGQVGGQGSGQGGASGGAAASEAGPSGFAIASSDGAWRLRFRGLIQFDGRLFSDDATPDSADTWLLRRVRPSIEGNAGERVSFRIMPDFGGGTSQLVDAYVDTKLGSALSLRVGKYKPPVTLERLQSASDLPLVERSFVTELAPNRDVGLQLSGGKRAEWQVGLFDGTVDGRSVDFDDDGKQDLAARLFVLPFKDTERDAVLGFGVAATYGSRTGSPSAPLLAGYRSPGQQTVFSYRNGANGTFADGDRVRIVPQLYWYGGPFGLFAEAIRVRQDVSRDVGAGLVRSATLDNDAWQITGEWFVTGQKAGFRNPSGPGAVQLVARVAELTVDDESFAGGAISFADPAAAARRARTTAVGVSWFPVRGLKATAAYQLTDFDGGAADGDRPDEKVLLFRLQEAF